MPAWAKLFQILHLDNDLIIIIDLSNEQNRYFYKQAT